MPDRGLSVKRIVHLGSFHRTPSGQDLAGDWIDQENFPSWYVPLFQVVWKLVPELNKARSQART
ncbi:hypothetical protein C6366_07170 [Desulfonatronum sp. SC1]|nr:hypothetical protein C6366_07170 [Desulfonatronum sp. SC1]